MLSLDHNERVRLAALAHVDALRRRWDDHVPAGELEQGFRFEEERIRLVGPGMGIFKPKQLTDGPITVRTSLAGRYADEPIASGGGLHYDFAPPAREYDNAGLKELCQLGRPLIYLVQVAPKTQGSEYAIIAPVFVTNWSDARRKFAIAFRRSSISLPDGADIADRLAGDRVEPAYRMVEMRALLHQAHFRRLVLAAYRQRCAVCELRVRPLLDAAHIVADSDQGDAAIQNGLGLCVLHHRAFDRGVLRIRPDYSLQIRADDVAANDTFARLSLVEFENRRITLPRNREHWPSQDALAQLFSA